MANMMPKSGGQWMALVLLLLVTGTLGGVVENWRTTSESTSEAGASANGAENTQNTTGDAAAGGQQGEGVGGTEAKAGTPAPSPAPAPGPVVRDLAAGLKALQDFLGVFVSIPGIALLALWMFRAQLMEILREVSAAMADRGVTLDIGSVSVIVGERAPDVGDDSRSIFLPSPFEIEDDTPRESAPSLSQIPPQLTFQVSDYVGDYWERKDPAPAVRMRLDFAALDDACKARDITFARARPLLVEYARSLERARFRQASRLADLLDRCPVLRAGLAGLEPQDVTAEAEDFLMLYAAGVAWAQHDLGRWPECFEILDRIMWKDDAPLYHPAGSTWIAAGYHHLLTTHSGKPLDGDDVVTAVVALMDRGERLVIAIGGWNGAGAGAPHGYYLREAHKDLGDVASIFAEHGPARSRDAFLQRARPHLEASARTLDGEEASPLDHNNLGDFYRQLGDDASKRGDMAAARPLYAQAHDEMTRAFAGPGPTDPTFHNTLALLLHSGSRNAEAVRVLAEYGRADASESSPQDIAQYFDNQVLAAKLLVAQHPSEPSIGIAAAVALLNGAAADLAGLRGKLNADKADDLEAQIQELLGFAYLQLPGTEDQAVTAFDRLLQLRSQERESPLTFRARVGAATALGRSARLQRRRYAAAAAASLRNRAEAQVTAALAYLASVKIGPDVARPPGDRSLGAWLDALRAAQLLAEEWFAGHESTKAADLTTKAIAEPLATLGGAVDAAAAARDPSAATMQSAVRRLRARHALLHARLLVRADSTLNSAATPTKVRETLVGARGVSAQFECEADLELGAVLLAAARLAKGDPQTDYQGAIAALEHAAEANAPDMRAEVLRQLARAYALRSVILRKPAATGQPPAEKPEAS